MLSAAASGAVIEDPVESNEVVCLFDSVTRLELAPVRIKYRSVFVC